MRPALALFVLAVFAFLPFFGYPEWRGTEGRRVQISQEMVESGDYIVPRLWGEETYAKPPLHYWLLAGSIRLFGFHAWNTRLVSVLGFFVLALAGYHFLRRWNGETAARLGSVGILVAPVVMHDVPFAEIDPTFAVLTVLSILFLSDGVFGGSRIRLVAAGVLGGLAVMTKGPPYLMFVAGPLVVWWRHNRLRGFFSYAPGVVVFYALYKLVLDAAGPADDVGSVAVAESIGRMAFWTPQSLRGIPTHVAKSLFVIGLPFSFWLVTWVRSTRRLDDRRSCRQNFLVWGALGAAAILLFSVGRATRYMLPAVPLFVFGLAPLVAKSLHDESLPAGWVRRTLLITGALAGLGAIAIVWAPYPYPGTTAIALLAISCVALVTHSQGQLVRYALILCLVVAWTAFPDRIRYFSASDRFVPDRAITLAREFATRKIDMVETDGHVDSEILLHTRDRMPGSLTVHGDSLQRRPETRRWLLIEDRGTGDVRDVAGYRDVLRVQLGRNKSLSLRERL